MKNRKKYNQTWKEKRNNRCLDCGILINPYSKRCIPCNNKITQKKIIATGILKGKNCHLWKGGKINVEGYIYILKQNHPFASKKGYIAEHRLVMENWLRKNEPNHPALIKINGEKYLRKNWIPHHINEKRDDNRIENLKLMRLSEHTSLHTKGRKHSQTSCERMSVARLKLKEEQGYLNSPETREKIRERLKGKHSPNKGKKMTAKQRRSYKKYWASLKKT